MKIAKTLIVLFSMLLSGSLMAQKSATELLNELATKTNAYTNIKVGFNYEMTNTDADIHEKTQGTLIVAGDKYRLKIAGQEIICDGKTLWTFIADADEVQISEVNPEESFSPSKLLSSYTDDYDAKLDKEFTENGRAYYLFKLTPKDKNSSFDYVLLKVDKEKMQLASFTMFDFDKNKFSYTILEYLTNVSLPANAFTFNAADYPNAEIIDMR